MKRSMSWITASLLAALVALGCKTGDDQTILAAEPAAGPQEPAAAPQEPRAATETVAVEAQEPRQEPKPAAGPAPQQGPKPAEAPAPQQGPDPQQPEFLPNAFPPIVPDTERHQDAWMQQDCARCHETGVGDAPRIVHKGMPDILLEAKCRTCHVFVPGAKPRPRPEVAAPEPFAEWAFPPMVPASDYHRDAWLRGDCLLCHESGVKGAPRIEHKGMPKLLLESKCRTCHVQVRAIELDGR